jgi:FtsP/CotA-like multicopper oxidase with cupredoxin domain
MPPAWQSLQKSLLQHYDATAPYLGKPGGLLPNMKLWPPNADKIAKGYWPQYHIGAVPFCFPLPKYDPAKVRMGQAPGTHWYHAHKHGSTALNVANGMTGAFIIEGQYDDDLHHYYGPGLRQQVLVVQQLGTVPFPLTNPNVGGPGSVGKPPISVNGRLDPVVAMKPGEVQLWRIVNGAFRDAVQFAYFKAQPPNVTGIVPPPKPQCNPATAPPPPPTVQWRQIAQDGVQFALPNYQGFGARNNRFNLAPANRADLLVQAPAHSGRYALCVVTNNALLLDNGPTNPAKPGAYPKPPSVLLTVNVGGTPVSPAMNFIPDANFPKQPSFLSDITSSEIVKHRTLVFGPGFNTIDGKSFEDGVINQQMLLNTAEEWIVKNEANDKSHPFHIHINPFQILELFQPNAPDALNKLTPDGKPNPCYVDPSNPDTWDPARPGFKDTCPTRVLPGPWVWWDTFAIPTSRTIPLDSSYCQTIVDCQARLAKPYDPTKYNYQVSCNSATPVVCSVLVDGWFRQRSRFVDFTGQYVLHCHILIHEDRGMMQLIEVTAVPAKSNKSVYTHH